MKLRNLLVCAATGLALLAGASPGAAAPVHGDGGLLEVEAAHPTATGVHYIVRLTYRSDGHPVDGAAITATPVGPDGREQPPVELQPYDDDGRYQGAVELPDPGTWTVRFSSADPEATAEATADVEATTTTAEAAESADTTGADAGFAAADDGTGGSEDAGADTSDDGDGFPVLIVVAAAVVAIGGLFAALRVIRRNRPGGPSGPGRPDAPETAAAPEASATDATES